MSEWRLVEHWLGTSQEHWFATGTIHSTSELNLLGSKLITYKKEKTGRAACSQPGVTRLLGRLLRVAVRGVCSFVFSDTGHYTKLDGINVDSRRATLGRS